MAVAINQHHGFKPFSRSQRCKLQSFSHLDQTILELNRATLSHHSFKQSEEADIIHRSFSTPCLPLTTLSSGEDLPSSSHPRIEIVRGTGAPVHALVVEVAIAMASGLHPKPLPNGLGGAYLFCNPISGKNIAVAKPVDEEPLALNNPKDLGDAQILRSELPLLRESSIRVLVVCTIFLKHAAAAGLCLTDIGLLMTREFCGGKETPSELETICSQVKASVPLDVPNNNNEEEEGSSCEISGISFGDMRKGEWESFLEIFDKVLCGVFGNKQV
ncbi:hypothetical protein Ahy_A06g028749 isoform A [Arachis hypogaea]|uniref:1-phosphatidylinositol 4-kinase n=1 Tax=Arachis hypogaea TaxID=3818 RepID=A0A445CRK6_ARAHY|nr:hypothetical protein Ahy_A06g028749 isoform A [Arachis hypogaea]